MPRTGHIHTSLCPAAIAYRTSIQQLTYAKNPTARLNPQNTSRPHMNLHVCMHNCYTSLTQLYITTIQNSIAQRKLTCVLHCTKKAHMCAPLHKESSHVCGVRTGQGLHVTTDSQHMNMNTKMTRNHKQRA